MIHGKRIIDIYFAIERSIEVIFLNSFDQKRRVNVLNIVFFNSDVVF